MRGKTVMVTGATGGIGFATARGLAAKGAELILVGRAGEKCARAADAINAAIANSTVSYLVADLSSLREVRRLADEFHRRWPRLDVLVNNAGGIYSTRRVSADGIEMTFALNHLSYFALTLRLLPALQAAPRARIVNVASCAHENIALDFDDLGNARRYGAHTAYKRSKLANVYFTHELARRLAGSGITVNALHPGLVATGLGGDNGWLFRSAVRAYFRLFGAVSAEKGAETSIHLASAPELDGITGRYFSDSRQTPSSDISHDAEAARRLWDESVRLTGLDLPAAQPAIPAFRPGT